MSSAVQRSFSGGELAPGLYGRADQSRYQSGLKTCRNFQVQRFGGAQNRPGTRLITETKGSGVVRLVNFVFNATQTYVLEFGNLYMRVIRNGVLLESSPGVPYEIVTPYAAADLLTLQWVQSADVVTIVHPKYQPAELRRTGHTAWTLVPIVFTPSIAAPTSLGGSGTAGGATVKYKVSAVAAQTLEESLPGGGFAFGVGSVTQANPPVVTTTGVHGYVTGDQVVFDNVVGMTALANQTFTITVLTTTTFSLAGIDTTSSPAFVSGTVRTPYYAVTSITAPSPSTPITLGWSQSGLFKNFYVYKESNGVYGFIGIAGNVNFVDTGITPDTSDGPIDPLNPFPGTGDYPSTVTYSGQRQCFANTDNRPERVWMSQTGNFHNFASRTPLQDDDPIIFTLAGRQVNEVMHLIELGGRLVAFTSGGEWTILGDTDGVAKPTAINARQQSYHGSGDPSPIAIGNTALYLQARGSIVRDLRWDLNSDGYQGDDLTVFSAHLFAGRQIIDWAFAEIPQSIGWAVRDDGILLGLTYMPDQQVIAWHRHDTQGLYERIVTVPEGTEDAVYVVVNRTIGGVTKRFIERFASRVVTDIAVDAFFVDCGLTYDGRNTTATTMSLSTGAGWTVDDVLTLTASAPFFVVGDPGNAIVLTIGGAKLTCRILGYTSSTVVTVSPSSNVPVAFQGPATAVWSRAVDDLSGLSHLEGCTVSILGDGNVEDQQVVTAGSVHLSRPYSVVHVGLPYLAQMESLDLENVQSETQTDKAKLVKRVAALVESSRSIQAGSSFDHLYEATLRTTENYGDPTALRTGTVLIDTDATWDVNGHWCVQLSDPLPLAVLAVAPAGEVGE